LHGKIFSQPVTSIMFRNVNVFSQHVFLSLSPSCPNKLLF